MDPSQELPIICGGTHYYTQHFLFPPSRSLSTDRRRSRSGSEATTSTASNANANAERKSKSNNTKWRPPSSLDELLDTLATLENMGDRESAVARSIREDKGEYQGVAKFLETFWTTTPIYPRGWISQAHPTLGGLSDTVPAEQSNSPSQAASDAKVEAPLAGNSHNPKVPGISMAMTPTMAIATTPTTDQELLALHRLLTLVDPREAGRWHWRDGRKVRRGLERFWEDVIASRRTQTPPRKVECNTIISPQDMQSGYKEPVDGAVVEAQGQDQGALSVASVKVEDDASNDGSARFVSFPRRNTCNVTLMLLPHKLLHSAPLVTFDPRPSRVPVHMYTGFEP